MDALITTYLVIGIGLFGLSIWLSRRLRSGLVRAAIPAFVFAVWFSTGVAVGEGGAMPAPLLLLFWSSTSKLVSDLRAMPGGKYYNPWPLHYWLNGVFWGVIEIAVVWLIIFIVMFGVARIFRRRKGDSAASYED
jgi:hypothetical protein